jgi:hypothetical protein
MSSALDYTVAQVEARLVAIQVKIDELLGMPTKASTGKNFMDLSGTYPLLIQEQNRWLVELEKARIRAGLSGPRRRLPV